MTIRRVSRKETKRSLGPDKMVAAPPPGISPVLRASWRFAQDTAKRFNRELIKDHVDEFLRKLGKRFT